MGKMFREVFLLALVSLFIFSSGAFAEPVSLQMAEDVARTHLRANNEREKLASLQKRKVFEKRSISMPDIIELQDDQTGETLAYVLSLKPKGFIVVSPDTDIPPVIAYSFEGNFPLEEFQDNVLLHMVTWDMENRLEAIPIVSDAFKEKNNELWEKYLSAEDSFIDTQVGATQYGPYLETTWDQGHPLYGGYNIYCPCDPNAPYILGLCQLSLVGCVATAMAQIVNYHQYPSSVTFTSNDNYWSIMDPKDGYGTRSIYITATGANMPSITYPAVGYTAAMLSYACGVSIKMKYSCKASGISDHAVVASAFKNKFAYTSATFVRNAPPYTTLFASTLQENLRNAQPAQLGITEADGTGGHSIVCDGYIHALPVYYHLNFGWGGSNPDPKVSDWWYTLPSGMPDDYENGIVSEGVLDIIPPERAAYVDPSGVCNGNTPCYTTIQSAINAAGFGSVIKILAGTYAENLDLNSSNNYTLQGGWNSTYTSRTSTSSVSSMTFGSNCGTVTVGNMNIQ